MLSQNLSIIEYKPNHFRVSGTANFFSRVYNKIEIDGEIYTNQKTKEITIDYDELFNSNNGHIMDFDYLESIYGTLYFWSPYENNPINRIAEYSTNEYVNAFMHIKKYLSDKGLKFEVYSGKRDTFRVFNEGSILNSIIENSFCFELDRYGFNNIIAIYITYQDMLKYNLLHLAFEKKPIGFHMKKYSFLFEPITNEHQKTERLLKFIEIQSQTLLK